MFQFAKFLLTLSWIDLIFASSQIALPPPDPAHQKVLYDYIFDKDVDLLLYGVLAFLTLNFLSHYPLKFLTAALWTIAVALLFGAGDEYHQLFVHGREASLYDLAFDIIGGIVGIGMYRLWFCNARFRHVKK